MIVPLIACEVDCGDISGVLKEIWDLLCHRHLSAVRIPPVEVIGCLGFLTQSWIALCQSALLFHRPLSVGEFPSA